MKGPRSIDRGPAASGRAGPRDSPHHIGFQTTPTEAMKAFGS